MKKLLWQTGGGNIQTYTHEQIHTLTHYHTKKSQVYFFFLAIATFIFKLMNECNEWLNEMDGRTNLLRAMATLTRNAGSQYHS